MTVALIISTYNWPEALALVLDSVKNQSIIPHQVIIADDGSSEETAAVIQEFSSILPLSHVWHEDQGFRKTIIVNKAIASAAADYIIEIDGDIILHRHFIKDHLRVAEKGFFIQGSRVMLGEQLSQRVLSKEKRSFHCFSKGLVTRFNAIRFPLLSFLFHSKPTSSKNAKGCNMAFWRKDYIHINGYFNDFKGWGWEDYEFAERLINSGVMKKKVKWAALGYHIFHKLSSRANFQHNELIYRQTVEKKIVHRSPGFREVASI